MTRKISSLIIIMLVITILLNGCQSRQSIGKCIPPPVSWEFPVMATISTDMLSDLKNEVPPSGSWTGEAILPFEDHIYNIITHSTDEIWVLTEEKLLLYQTSTHTWNEFSMIGDLKVIPGRLFESKNGTLWGTNLYRFKDSESEENIPLFVRYSDENGQFEFVSDHDNILNSNMVVFAITEPGINPSGVLWMLVEEDFDESAWMISLISFDTTSLQATRHLTQKRSRRTPASPESNFTEIAIPPDGNIWIADGGLRQLLYYDPDSGISHYYEGNPGAYDGFSRENLRGYFNLYVDRLGRLWVDDRGWLDFSDPKNPIWHKVIRSPVLISDSASPENQFVWSRPDLIYQSSDGMYWFSDANIGLVRLNPETGEWCNFTSGSSPIAEDNQGNLWIAVFGKLYRYQLNP